MESGMTKEELENVAKRLEEQLEIKRREYKEFIEILDKQKQIVFRFLCIAGVALMLHLTLIHWMLHSENMMLRAFGSYIQPFNITVFFGTGVYGLVRGYDAFINSEYKLAKKINVKLNRSSLTEQIQLLLEDIRFLQREVDRVRGELRKLVVKEDTI